MLTRRDLIEDILSEWKCTSCGGCQCCHELFVSVTRLWWPDLGDLSPSLSKSIDRCESEPEPSEDIILIGIPCPLFSNLNKNVRSRDEFNPFQQRPNCKAKQSVEVLVPYFSDESWICSFEAELSSEEGFWIMCHLCFIVIGYKP